MTAHIPSHMENIADIDHHDANASLHEIIKSRGFFCEESEVTTQDGYLVTVNRLHNGSQDGGRSKYPVMLVHGNKTSGVMWLVMDTRGQCRQSGQDECDISLAYTLANQGFDVWIVSMRGSRPSRRHVSLDPESAKYWDFSMDDLTSDMAQLVDHVKAATQSSTLGVIGFSLGGAVTLGLLSSRPEYNDVIKPCILIAPAWDVRDSCPIGNITTDHAARQYNSPDSTNVYDTSIEHITSSLAAWKPWSLPVLMVGHFLGALAYGFNRRTFSFTRLAVLCAHSSMRQSTKLYRQYMNSVKTGNLSKFDYGPFENETRYGSTTVPEYDLGSVTNQYISLVYSLGDVCVRPQGVLSVKSRLNSNIFHEYVIPDSEYTHLDFYMAPDVHVLVNKPVLDMLKRSLSDEPKLSAPSSG